MEFEIICQLLLATFLGAIIGLERELKEREAGVRTYSLVCLGSCIFTLVVIYFSQSFANSEIDLVRVVQAVAIGVGFIGSGTIFKGEEEIEGLTTAAGLWTVAAIGIAVGSAFYFLAIFGTLLVIFILAGLGQLQERIFSQKK